MNVKETINYYEETYKDSLKNNYAKSGGITLKKHILDLLENRKLLEKHYPGILTPHEWDLLKLSIFFHDFGKTNKLFQKKIKPHALIRDDLIPHNYLSPLFLFGKCKELSNEDLLVIIYSVINHHARGSKYIKNDIIGVNLLRNDIINNKSSFKLPILINDEILDFYENQIIFIVKNFGNIEVINKKLKNNDDLIKTVIKVSGLLIKIDHSSSGEIDVENEPITQNREKLFIDFINNESKLLIEPKLKDFQKEFMNKENLVLVADTGMGKTGLSVLWSKRKMFYVLPNRTSTNAMFETIKKIYKESSDDKVGLMHSTSLFYHLQIQGKKSEKVNLSIDEDKVIFKDHENTRALSKPVTICTADQLFTAVFKYPTYEKIYATLSYSDIIIDEIQGFSPQQILPLIKQIGETTKLGARYLIITATLPQIIKEEFKKIGFNVIANHPLTYDNIFRHKINIEYDKTIFDFKDNILNQNKNVLVIVNNVSTAQELFEYLTKIANNQDINLLHSRFIWEERFNKEEAIKIPNSSIWITTQLVEASLDIDYDILFTESATVDSLIQRMGRIWRKRKTDYLGEFNIYIAGKVNEKKVNFIYEKILREKSLELIQNNLDKNGYLKSAQKREIVEQLYSPEYLSKIGSNYFKEWEKTEKILNSNWDYFCKAESQKTFRNVLTFEVIPFKFKDQANDLCEKLNDVKNIKDKETRKFQRINILQKLNNLKVSVPSYWMQINSIKNPYEILNEEYKIYYLNKCFKYNELGISLDKDILNTVNPEEVDIFLD